jgi:carboxylesterase type B
MTEPTCLVAVFVMLAAGLCIAQEPAPVTVEGGSVRGTAEDGLTVYRGIPFAAPPVGDPRWRAPQPAAKWEGVRLATKFAPGPLQGGNPPSGKSEDCLYLNVWTPAKSDGDRIPVLVWIYGGGFNAGATSERNYSGENLAKKGVVLVSIAYRVGQLGFLAHPELSAESPNHVSGNYGLLDMIAGLQWVQKNIAAFGGDPGKVTIFGESAGGIAVSMLCASPLAKGLFQGVVSQSGGSFGPPRPATMPGENLKRLADAERSGEAYAKNAGVSSIAELRKIAADKLPGGRGLAWPIIEGWVIPDDQYKLYEAGKFNDTPILVGYNSDEGLTFSPQAGRGSPHGQDVAYVFQHLNASSPRTTKSDLATSEAMATYWTNFAKRGDPSGEGVPAWPAFSDAEPGNVTRPMHTKAEAPLPGSLSPPAEEEQEQSQIVPIRKRRVHGHRQRHPDQAARLPLPGDAGRDVVSVAGAFLVHIAVLYGRPERGMGLRKQSHVELAHVVEGPVSPGIARIDVNAERRSGQGQVALANGNTAVGSHEDQHGVLAGPGIHRLAVSFRRRRGDGRRSTLDGPRRRAPRTAAPSAGRR